MMSRAAAPSEICDELPAVSSPSGRKTGCRAASASSLVPGRMPSSRSITRSAPSASRTATGTISPAKRPSSVARCARRCDSAAKRSIASRPTPQRSATISPERPCSMKSPSASPKRARKRGP